MKNSDQTLQLIGRPGNEPIIKTFDENRMVARFSFATNVQTTDENGNTQWVTKWHRVVAWGKVAELVQRSVKKGVKMTIVGKDAVRPYIDKEGVAKESKEIVLYNLSVFDKEIA